MVSTANAGGSKGEPGRPAAARPPRPQQAGLVLAVLGLVYYGSTSPYALVLCVEWLYDPARPARLRRRDRLGLVFAVPGIALFGVTCVAMWDYRLGEPVMAPLIAAYWLAFGVWVLVRARTRWRAIAARRAVGCGIVDGADPGSSADGPVDPRG